MDNATISLLILLASVLLFIWNKLPVAVVSVLVALSLYAFGVLDLREALAGFGDPVIIFIASLFVVSEGIDASGLTAWVGQRLIDRGGGSRIRLMVAICALAAIAAALVTPSGAVAALLPMVVVLAVRTGQAPSKLLMPLAFVSGAGALLALTGSPVNVIVSESAQEAGVPTFGFFEFAIVGVPLVIGTTALVAILGPRLLPTRVSRLTPPDLSEHADQLASQYDVEDGFYRLRVRAHSPLIGSKAARIDLADYPDIDITAAQRADLSSPDLQESDVIIASGPSRQISHFAMDHKLAIAMKPAVGADGIRITAEAGVAEVVVPPRSALIGETVFPGMKRSSDVVILAVRRLGRDRGPGPTELAEGDAMLMHGRWSAIEALADDRNVLVVDSPDMLRRQTAPLGGRAIRAVCALASMVVLLAFGLVPPAVAGLLAALAMVLLRVVTTPQAIRSVSWETIILIGGLIPLSVAIKDSGAANDIARVLTDIVGSGRPYVLMIALFVLTAVLGQIISNTATVLIIAPVAVVAAQSTGVSVQPMLMLIAVAGAASFLTPIATATNMMVMDPGGYRFGDYWKLGLPLMLLWLAIAIAIIPLFWPL